MRLTSLFALAATLGIWTGSAAEPLVSMNNVNPLTSDVGYNVVIYPLDGNLSPVNQIDALKTIVVFAAGANNVQAQIPASTTPYKFVGLRIWYRVEKGTGIAPVYWAAFDHSQAAKAVPAGTPMACTYTAPALTVGDLSCALVVVVPPVVVPPPPPPPPPPTTAFTTSGTKMPPAAQIIDKDGATWTLMPLVGGVAGQTGSARNGVRKSNSVEFLTIDKTGVMWQSDFKSGAGWDRWNGTDWITTGATGPVF